MRINIFYLIAGLLSLLFVAILWLLFVPTFYDTDVYDLVRNLALIMSALLIIVAAIQIYLAVRKENANSEESP
jgi:cytochrome c oxidase assembly factor CtaG